MAQRQLTGQHESASAPPPAQKSTKTAEPRNNIPVICNSSRTEEGSGKKPQGIHLNPKFFKPSNERPRQEYFVPRGGAPQQQRFHHDVSIGFNGYPNPRHFGPFPQRFPSPSYQPCRPNFSTFQGPPYQPNFPPGPCPSQNRFNWQDGPGFPNFPPGHHAGPQPPFPGQFPPNYVNYGVNQPGQHPPPEFYPEFHGRPDMGPIPGPSYYQGFPDNEAGEHDRKLRDFDRLDERRRQDSRSRSRSSSSRRRRSLSGSSAGYSTETSRGRRSRSLSSGSNSRDRHSSPGSDSSQETLWASDNECNSDSDLDLSKPLDSLTRNVNSKSLLRGALKCLGSTKIQTMIPLELCQLSKKDLFRMCKELLDETEHDELIKVMDGRVNVKAKDEHESQSQKEHGQTFKKSNTSDSDKDSICSVARRKVSKKKKSKKKRKKQKKSHVPQVETESDAESQESLVEDNSNGNGTSEDSSSTSDETVSKPTTSSSTTQQSLLELIQIEYKTKAINVMLKNLGVATEISALVSNALHTNGITAAQGLVVNQEAVEIEKSHTSAVKIDVPSDENHALISSDAKSIDVVNESDSDTTTKSENDNQLSESASDDKEDASGSNTETNSIDTKNIPSSSGIGSVPLDEKELLKGVVEDVLDIGVGANEGLDFLDI